MPEALRSVSITPEDDQSFLERRRCYRQQRRIDRMANARQRDGSTTQSPVSFIVDMASPRDRKMYAGVTFEPDRVPTNVRNSRGEFSNQHRALLKSLEEQRVAMMQKYTREGAQSMPEFQELTAQFLNVRDAHIAARARR